MKKCSHSVHESLTQLNITPLLDLAFVLLVIFIITTMPPVNNKALKLPTASKHLKEPPRKANYITVQADGKIFMNQKLVPLNGLQQLLVSMRLADPDLNIIVRGDRHTKYERVRAVLDACQGANVEKVDLATQAADQK
jgi:biopolymer transport protein ExbD